MSGRTKLPLNMVFQQVMQEREKDPARGGSKGLQVIIGELKHLPPKKDIIASAEAVKKAYREDIEFGDAEVLAHAMKLGLTARSMLEDRESLKTVLECVYDVLEKWEAWLKVGEEDEPVTEEVLQEHFETVTAAMASLQEIMDSYNTAIFTKLMRRKDTLSKKRSATED
ncbi:MAG: hypothetical protein LBT15_01760 [Synergistaceae bacterium]|jgi:hypothetical protein|nr:hypothetical protein [Synergistaceae bacterium]